MTCFTGPERDAVLEVVSGCDIVFLNRAELSSLVPEVPDWQAAQRASGPGAAARRGGQGRAQGAVLVTTSSTLVRPPASVDAVIDPTGAGTPSPEASRLCAAAERGDDGFFPAALEEGLSRAAMAISTFGTDGLRRLAVEPT